MRIGIVTAFPEQDWHSARLIAAARRACARRSGVRCEIVDPASFWVAIGDDGPRVRLGDEGVERYRVLLLARGLRPEGDADFQIELYRACEEAGLLLINPIDALLRAVDKFRTSLMLARAGLPTPTTVVAQTADQAEGALSRLGAVMVKPLYGSRGEGIVELRGGPGARQTLETLLSTHRALYLQRLVAPVGQRGPRRDLRLFVVGDRVAGAISRQAPAGEWRTNIHRGGVARPHQPSPEMRELAVAATRTLGLTYGGVDLMEDVHGPTVLEVNGTPLWNGLYRVTGLDMAEPIIDEAIARGESMPGTETVRRARRPRGEPEARFDAPGHDRAESRGALRWGSQGGQHGREGEEGWHDGERGGP